MVRLKVEWDPSWDDGWPAAGGPDLESMIEEEHPPEPERAVEYYRYGFSVARRHPLHEWPDVESELYQDYMAGVTEPGEEEEWEEVRAWVHRGWEAGAKPHVHVHWHRSP